MTSKRLATTVLSISRQASRRAPSMSVTRMGLGMRAAARVRPCAPVLSLSRGYASPAPEDSPAGAQPVGAQLRASIENELSALALAVTSGAAAGPASHTHRYLRPLTAEEVELANMGQVPSLPGGEVMALLDVAPTAGTLSAQGAGPGGAGVHVPLLARAGETDPSIPCYPLAALYGAQSARVVEAVHAVLAAQRGSIAAGDKAGLDVKADEGTPLVALVVPHDGEKRDLAIQLAIGLFRLAMNEGNGHEEGQ